MATTAASPKTTATTTTSAKQVNAWQRFRRNQLGLAGAVIVLLLIVMALTAPWLAPNDPAEQSLLNRRQPPNETYLLGTDEFGRDILSRLLYGARYTLLISVSSVGIGLIIGGSLGFIAGYVGGLTSGIIMRLMDLLLAFPYLLLAIMIVSALGPGVRNTIVAIGIWT
ncbi:MAG: ABC transporter permease, partial [Deinococcota bacterium]